MPIIDLKLDPDNPQIAYFTDRRQILKYDPSAAPNPLSDISVPGPTAFEYQYPSTTYAIAIAVAPHGVLYASYAYTGNFREGCLAGLYRSADSGAHWVQVTVPAASDYLSSNYAYHGNTPGCQGWYDNVLAVDPLNANHVVAAGVAIADFDVTDPANPTQRNLSDVSHVHPTITH